MTITIGTLADPVLPSWALKGKRLKRGLSRADTLIVINNSVVCLKCGQANSYPHTTAWIERKLILRGTDPQPCLCRTRVLLSEKDRADIREASSIVANKILPPSEHLRTIAYTAGLSLFAVSPRKVNGQMTRQWALVLCADAGSLGRVLFPNLRTVWEVLRWKLNSCK